MRCLGIDFLRGIAAFGIVGCHLGLSPRTPVGNLVTTFCDFNVGLFAAIAGFLMCGAHNGSEWLEYVKKRAIRLLPIYLVWSVIYLVVIAIFDLLLDGGQVNARYSTTKFWISALFWGGGAAHLWFLSSLFYVQILVARLFGACGKQWHGIAWIIAGGVLIKLGLRMDNWYGIYPIRLLAFIVTGYGLRRLVEPIVIKRYVIALSGAVALALAFHFFAVGRIHSFYADWIAVGPVLTLFVALDLKSVRLQKIATLLGATSLGVYLVHPIFTRALSFGVAKILPSPYAVSVVLSDWLLAWACSFVTVLILRKMPLLRRYS